MSNMKTLNGYGFDAAALGGKAAEYYIQPLNLLDNSDFRNPVNQREQTSYSGKGYTIDRWLTASSSYGVSVTDAGIVVVGMVRQYLTTVKDGKTYTIAAKNANGNLYVYSGGYGSDTIGDSAYVTLSKSSSTGYATFQIAAQSTAWEWAALYEGEYTAETLPPYVPKGYGAELVECKRYFQKYEGGAITPYYTSAANRYYNIRLESAMRTNPTIEWTSVDNERYDEWLDPGSTISFASSEPTHFSMSANGGTGVTSTSRCMLFLGYKASADL